MQQQGDGVCSPLRSFTLFSGGEFDFAIRRVRVHTHTHTRAQCRSTPLQVLRMCLCSCRHISACIHFHLCVCLESPFRQLFGLAGGALSQSLIYSGPFEIIELTHLSDGERRNAKRSPGEVPAAPAPNLSCLQIAQSLHHNRWDSCLSFLPHSHSHTYMSIHAAACAQMWQARITLIHTYTQRCSHTRHLPQTRQSGRHMYCTHLQTHTHKYTHIHSLPLSLSLLPLPAHSVLFLSRSDFHVQGQYQSSKGNITLS